MIKEQSLETWLDYIALMHPQAVDLGLARMESIAQELELTRFNARVITIAGTNGKGSVVKTLEQIYLKAGYHVAAYTSPHLLDFKERLQINNCLLSDLEWINAFNCVEQARKNRPLTFFEFTTLSALLICKNKKLDVMLLEVGLGGRLDAVNIVESDLAIVTSVDLDHMDWLGSTREAIGHEKAGIFRAGKVAVCADAEPPASLLTLAKDKGVTLYCYQKDYTVLMRGSKWEFVGVKNRYLLPWPTLTLQNVATGLMAVELLDLPVSAEKINAVIPTLKLPGRYEVVPAACKLILDVAHNPAASRLLAARLQQEPHLGKKHAVVGMRKDKDFVNTLSPLLSTIDYWHTVTINAPFGLEAMNLTEYLFKQKVTCYTSHHVSQALEKILSRCHPEDLVVVFGSFYTVADAKRYLKGL